MQLGNFEDLSVTRTSDWGWRLENQSALYESFEPAEKLTAPLPQPRFALYTPNFRPRTIPTSTSDESDDDQRLAPV